MKIILGHTIHQGKILLDDGTDITNDLMVTSIKIDAPLDGLIIAQMIVLPSEILVEIDESQVRFQKDSQFELIKGLLKNKGPYGKWTFSPAMVLGDDFGRGI